MWAQNRGEKFPGADETYTIEAMMQDKKALQGGTSHFLGQNFSKRPLTFSFLSKEGKQELAWTTSWGVTSRLIGSSCDDVHSDDDGLVLPPKIAPYHVVINVLDGRSKNPEALEKSATDLKEHLCALTYDGEPVRALIDTKIIDLVKNAGHGLKKGVPFYIELGDRELSENTLCVTTRSKENILKETLDREAFVENLPKKLADTQAQLFQGAQRFQTQHTRQAHTKEEFEKLALTDGFIAAYWSGDKATENWLKETFGMTARCIPLDTRSDKGTCLFTGQDSASFTLFAKAY